MPAGVNINMNKSENLGIGDEDARDFELDVGKLKTSHTYFGTIFCKNGTSEKEIDNRLGKGRAVLKSTNRISTSQIKQRGRSQHMVRMHGPLGKIIGKG